VSYEAAVTIDVLQPVSNLIFYVAGHAICSKPLLQAYTEAIAIASQNVDVLPRPYT